jgi:hypothetical protein
VPRKQRLLLDKHNVVIPTLSVLAPEQQKLLSSYYNAYYVSLADRLQKYAIACCLIVSGV